MALSRAVVALSLVLALAGCSDPYKQVIEAPDSKEYASFVGAMKKLPTDEKNLVNEYIARKEADRVRPAGITLREAIDEQRRFQAEEAALSSKLINGAVKVAQALGPKAPVVVQPPAAVQPPAPVAPQAGTPVTPQVSPAAPAPTATAAPGGQPVAATGLEMSALLQEIDGEPHPNRRVERIRQAAATRWFTTRQAIALARTVPFPGMQVEALSALYPRVVDPQSFDEVYAIFAFADDRDALRARVEAQRAR